MTHVFFKIKQKNFGTEQRIRILLFIPLIPEPRFHIYFLESFVSLIMFVFFTMAQDSLRIMGSSLSCIHDYIQNHYILQDSSGPVIIPTRGPLPDNSQHSQRQISTPLVEFEQTILLSELPHTHTLDSGATGTGNGVC